MDKQQSSPNPIRQYAIQCLSEEAKAITDLIDQLDDNFNKAAQLMYHCHGKIIVTGVGKTAPPPFSSIPSTCITATLA